MKLASLKLGRDGRQVVVSCDLSCAADASAVAPTLQAALYNWPAEPRLEEIADGLEAGRIAHIPFDQSKCAAPLPRSYGWADGSAYVNHVSLVREARGGDLPESFWTDPLMYRGGSDSFLGARDPIKVGDAAWGVDLEAEIAVVVSDVRQGASPKETAPLIKLPMLVNDVSLRNLIPAKVAKGFGFPQSKGQTAFSPVADRVQIEMSIKTAGLRRHRSGARTRPMRRCSRRRARLLQAGIRIADSMSLQASAQAVQASAQTRQ